MKEVNRRIAEAVERTASAEQRIAVAKEKLRDDASDLADLLFGTEPPSADLKSKNNRRSASKTEK